MIAFIVVSSAVIVINCCFWFEQKSQLLGFLGGGSKVFWNIYISMIVHSSKVKLHIYVFTRFSFGLWNINSKDPGFKS